MSARKSYIVKQICTYPYNKFNISDYEGFFVSFFFFTHCMLLTPTELNNILAVLVKLNV